MDALQIRPLNANHIHQANSNSMSGNRGKITGHNYEAYARSIMGWPVSDEKKEKLLDKLHRMFSEKLRYEAQHVSVIVAGPANYNARRLDKSDQILSKANEIATWYENLERGLANPDDDDAERAGQLIEMIRFCDSRPELLPTTNLMKLAFVDNASFILLYEEMQPKYRWRKNSSIAQLYARSKAGEVTEIRKVVKVEHSDYVGYIEGDRAYIRFTLRPQRQLIVALKSRKWCGIAAKVRGAPTLTGQIGGGLLPSGSGTDDMSSNYLWLFGHCRRIIELQSARNAILREKNIFQPKTRRPPYSV